jgi:adenylylsulfate kinase
MSVMIDLQQNILKQNGLVVWLTGLSGAGKSTVANLLKNRLQGEGFFSVFA